MEPMQLIEQMRRDHARVLSEIATLESALASPDAKPSGIAADVPSLLDLLERQFRTHMLAEDEVLFPALLRALPASAGSLEPLHDEHAELRLMLKRLRATLAEPAGKSRDEQTAVQVHDLADLLRIHIRKEESLVFGVAARLLGQEAIDAVLARMNPDAHPDEGPRPNPTQAKGTAR